MEQEIILNLPGEKASQLTPAGPAPTDQMLMRELFNELNQGYITYEQPAYYFAIKRVMNFTASFVLVILVMSWLYPIIALLIKLTSKGPVFFIQKRTGYKGMSFDCYKFRTMHVNDDADKIQAISGDKRVTKIGAFLRLTHIDELPQLFNVLKGDMNIVGPRPHMLYHTKCYSAQIPYYNLRHEAVPGITGLAQVKGYIGEIITDRDLRKRVEWDIYYLKSRNTTLDAIIMFQTLMQTFKKAAGKYKRHK